jgi:putative ABC transport system permease protein
VFTHYTQALTYVGRERKLLSFILAKPDAGVSIAELNRRIESSTGLRAMSSAQFGWATIVYHIKNTGFPVNFGLTVAIALIVGPLSQGRPSTFSRSRT